MQESSDTNNFNTHPTKDLIISCPHCNQPILIDKLNCRIFRHGIFKRNGKQIHPHSSKELCDFYTKEGLIYGCGRPIRS